MVSRSPGKALKLSVLFFEVAATAEIYTLSLHDALPISRRGVGQRLAGRHLAVEQPERRGLEPAAVVGAELGLVGRSEEHTSELQSQSNLVCRLLLEKKKN